MSRHISVPSFGYAPPSTPASKLTPPRSTTRPPSRAEAAGKAAAKRMDELQGGSHTFNKPYVYQEYGPTDPQACPSAILSPPAPRSTRPTTEIANDKRARLHKLFNKWVPRADEFYKSYGTLDLGDEEIKAVQDEIVSYRVNSALAAGKRTAYRAPWETAPQYLPPKPQAGVDAVDADAEDPFGLGLASPPASKGKGTERLAMDLLD